MKKSFMYLMLVFAVLFGAVASVGAQSKALEKDVKKRVKELKKEGWTLQASASTLDYALLKYRMYLEEDEANRISLTGIATAKNVKVGRESAIMNAITSYAARAKANVVGKAKSIEGQNISTQGEDLDKFAAAYEAEVSARIGSLIRQHFSLVKENADGTKEFNVFLSLDETAAKKAREEAALAAQNKLALEGISQEVRDFIGEPVPAEE